jgi:hypothetical protein
MDKPVGVAIFAPGTTKVGNSKTVRGWIRDFTAGFVHSLNVRVSNNVIQSCDECNVGMRVIFVFNSMLDSSIRRKEAALMWVTCHRTKHQAQVARTARTAINHA